MWFWWSKSLGLNILFREEHTGEPSVMNGAKIQPLYKPTILNPRDRVRGELETRVSPGKPRKGQLYSSARQRGPQQAKPPECMPRPGPPVLNPAIPRSFSLHTWFRTCESQNGPFSSIFPSSHLCAQADHSALRTLLLTAPKPTPTVQ